MTLESGLDFVDHHGRPGLAKRHIPETMGGGVALIDFDQDTDWDLVFVDGDPFDGSPPHPVRAYRNDGDMRFTEVTQNVLGDLRVDGYGVTVGDVDLDGADDLFIAGRGNNRLLLQRDGRLIESDALPKHDEASNRWATACALADFDRDGDLDLYIGDYVRFDDAARRRSEEGGEFRGHTVVAGPRGLPRGGQRILRNRLKEDGQLRFEDESGASEINALGYTLGVVVDDFDQDGDLDLYVANDSDPNFLYRNDGKLRFEECGLLAEVALSADGAAQAGMGVAVGDVDGDLRLDLVVTNFSHDANSLYLGLIPRDARASFENPTPPSVPSVPSATSGTPDAMLFRDATRRSGLFSTSFSALGFGCALLDGDGDGDLDLAVANGHVFPNIDSFGLGTTYAQPDTILENDGRGRFRSAPDAMPSTPMVSRALAVGDLDGDGRQDIVTTVQNGGARILRNRSANAEFAALRLRPSDHGSPLGAIIMAASEDGTTRIHTCPGAGSYLSSSSTDVHIAVRESNWVDLEIRWPTGHSAHIGKVRAGEAWLIRERNETAREPLPHPGIQENH